MAEIPTFQALGSGDHRAPAALAYARTHAAEWAAHLRLAVNGRRLPLRVDTAGIMGTLRTGQAGLSIRLRAARSITYATVARPAMIRPAVISQMENLSHITSGICQ